MSCFIVSQECMNNIINGLFWGYGFKRIYAHKLENKGYREGEDFQRLGDELYALNHLAVYGRYKEPQVIFDKFVWKDNSNLNKFQVLKSLHCLRYQCSEDLSDKTDAFKFLCEITDAWEDFIIGELPEYKDAKWD